MSDAATYRFAEAAASSNEPSWEAQEPTLDKALARALDGRELVLHYQPIFDLAGSGIVAVEALLRWRHPTLGLLLPGEFLPIAADTGILPRLEDWVLRTACREAVSWTGAAQRPLRLAVNLSARHFADPRIVEKIAEALDGSGLDPRLLELELTEGEMLHLVPRTLASMRRLAALGIRMSLDDFGTGYSNLAYLTQLPIERLKIDRIFVREIGRESQGSPLLDAIITMARGLGLHTVAEGVERSSQLEYLRWHGCEEAQGFFLSPALAGADLRTRIRARACRGAAA